jgi:hypothetical protein
LIQITDLWFDSKGEKQPDSTNDTNQGSVIRFEIFQMKIDTNHIYLIWITDLENKVLASGLPLNCQKIPDLKPLTHPIVPNHHPKVTLSFYHQFPLNLSNYTPFLQLNFQFIHPRFGFFNSNLLTTTLTPITSVYHHSFIITTFSFLRLNNPTITIKTP